MSEESKMPTKEESKNIIKMPTKDDSIKMKKEDSIKIPKVVIGNVAAGAGMDEANKKALNVMNEQGPKEFIKHVFTDQETGRQLSYSEMRSRYG